MRHIKAMEFDRFFKFSQLLLNDQFVLSYSGYVSEDILHAVGETLRERLEGHAKSSTQIRNVFSIFVELMQNIIRYGVDGPQPGPTDAEKPSFGIVMVADDGDHMSVLAGNFVSADEAKDLTERVNTLQACSSDELRALYRDKLRAPSEAQSKGASLGLIEIARRSSVPIECSSEDAGNGHYFFMIKASV